MRYITIALSKGRLAQKALDMFEHIGITCDEMKDESTRKLFLSMRNWESNSFLPNHLMFQLMWSMVRQILVL